MAIRLEAVRGVGIPGSQRDFGAKNELLNAMQTVNSLLRKNRLDLASQCGERLATFHSIRKKICQAGFQILQIVASGELKAYRGGKARSVSSEGEIMFGGKLRRALNALGDYIERYGAETGSGFFSTALTIISVWFAARALEGLWFWGVIVVAVGCLAFFGLALWSKEKQRRNANMEQSKEIEGLVRNYIYHLAKVRLKFGKEGEFCERISVYTFGPGGTEQFYRYSGNKEFMESTEKHEGCIRRVAYNEPWFFAPTRHDPCTAPMRYAGWQKTSSTSTKILRMG